MQPSLIFVIKTGAYLCGANSQRRPKPCQTSVELTGTEKHLAYHNSESIVGVGNFITGL